MSSQVAVIAFTSSLCLARGSGRKSALSGVAEPSDPREPAWYLEPFCGGHHSHLPWGCGTVLRCSSASLGPRREGFFRMSFAFGSHSLNLRRQASGHPVITPYGRAAARGARSPQPEQTPPVLPFLSFWKGSWYPGETTSALHGGTNVSRFPCKGLLSHRLHGAAWVGFSCGCPTPPISGAETLQPLTAPTIRCPQLRAQRKRSSDGERKMHLT